MFSGLSTASQYDLINYLHDGGMEMKYYSNSKIFRYSKVDTTYVLYNIYNIS